MTERVALIAGATGTTAKRIVDVLLEDPSWRVVGISRRPPAAPRERFTHIAADMLDPASLARTGAALAPVTHAFYCGRAPFKEGGVEDVDGNVTLLGNVVGALEKSAPRLAHVHLIEGAKWYGMHLGPYPTPSPEDAPRHMPPNFYYDQEDLLRMRQAGKRWTWSASRPSYVYDYAPERARNIVPLLGVWAALCRESGMALDFPGTAQSFTALADFSDATNLARAQVWLSTTEHARNQAFNVTDGEPIRWSAFWPRLARHFSMPAGTVRTQTLATWMADKQPLWDAVVRKHHLKPSRLDDLVVWGFGDFVWHKSYDVFASTLKLRKAGFSGVVDTEAQLLAHLVRYQEAGLIPR